MLGIHVASTPRPMTDAPCPDELYDDRSQLLPMAPGRLWIHDVGPEHAGTRERPVLLMLHSLLVTGWDFRQLTAAYAQAGQRVLVPDLFGCGNSDRPEALDTAGYGFGWHAELLARLLERLDVACVDIIAHGYGASIATQLARRLEREQGARLRRLVLVAPHLLPVEAPIALPGPMPRLRRAWDWVGFAPLVFRTVFRRADLRRFLSRSLSTPELLERPPLHDDVDVYWDRLCRTGGLEATQAMLEQLDALYLTIPDGVRGRLHEAARSIESPTMLVWGDRDQINPTALAEQTAARFGDAELRIIEGCGHAPQRERPDALMQVIASFERRMRG